MSMRFSAGLVIVTSVVGFCFGPSLTVAQDKVQPRGKWEYKIVKIAGSTSTSATATTHLGAVAGPGTMSEAALAVLGEHGWELVAVTGGQPFTKAVTVGTIGVGTLPPATTNVTAFTDTLYYFKRAK